MVGKNKGVEMAERDNRGRFKPGNKVAAKAKARKEKQKAKVINDSIDVFDKSHEIVNKMLAHKDPKVNEKGVRLMLALEKQRSADKSEGMTPLTTAINGLLNALWQTLPPYPAGVSLIDVLETMTKVCPACEKLELCRPTAWIVDDSKEGVDQ